MSNTIDDKLKKIAIEEYDALVQEIKPKRPLLRDCIWAFVVGGLICVLAQAIQNYLVSIGFTIQSASSATAVIMIFLAAFTTGLGILTNSGKEQVQAL